jgi:hypothetical protein
MVWETNMPGTGIFRLEKRWKELRPMNERGYGLRPVRSSDKDSLVCNNKLKHFCSVIWVDVTD